MDDYREVDVRDPDEAQREYEARELPPPRGVLVEGWCYGCRKKLQRGVWCDVCLGKSVAQRERKKRSA